MRNILYLIPSLVNSGGMERVLTDKVNHLVEVYKYRVFIVTTEMSDKETPFFKLNKNVEIINLSLNFNEKFNLNLFSKILETKKLLVIYKRKLHEIIIQRKIDICISMGGKDLEFLGGMKISSKKIYECHFERKIKSKFLEIQGKKNLFWKIYGRIRDMQHYFLASKFDKVVVLSKGAQTDWADLPNDLVVINNPSSIIREAEAQIDLNSKRVISIGNLTLVKGYDLLISAWSLIHYKHSDWCLEIFGSGELRKELEEQIITLGLKNSIRLKGLTRNVKKELSKSAFYVMSSRTEGLPMVLIESISCGLPIVAFDCESGPREIINNNDCGILVENGNVDKLAQAIEEMIRNPKLRRDMSLNALEKAEQYDIDNIMQEWNILFQQLLN